MYTQTANTNKKPMFYLDTPPEREEFRYKPARTSTPLNNSSLMNANSDLHTSNLQNHQMTEPMTTLVNSHKHINNFLPPSPTTPLVTHSSKIPEKYFAVEYPTMSHCSDLSSYSPTPKPRQKQSTTSTTTPTYISTTSSSSDANVSVKHTPLPKTKPKPSEAIRHVAAVQESIRTSTDEKEFIAFNEYTKMAMKSQDIVAELRGLMESQSLHKDCNFDLQRELLQNLAALENSFVEKYGSVDKSKFELIFS